MQELALQSMATSRTVISDHTMHGMVTPELEKSPPPELYAMKDRADANCDMTIDGLTVKDFRARHQA